MYSLSIRVISGNRKRLAISENVGIKFHLLLTFCVGLCIVPKPTLWQTGCWKFEQEGKQSSGRIEVISETVRVMLLFQQEGPLPDLLCGLVVRVRGCRPRDPLLHSRRYQIFWEVVGLERGPLNLVRKIEELRERKSSGSVYKTKINGRGEQQRWPRNTLLSGTVSTNIGWQAAVAQSVVRLPTKSHGVFFFDLGAGDRLQLVMGSRFGSGWRLFCQRA
jgi:hypothetical protein